MRRDDAERCMGLLIGLTTGWTDEAVVTYVSELGELHDPVSLYEACRTVGRTWTAPRRPPLAEILQAYHSEARRHTPAMPALTPAEDVLDPRDGRKVAYKAYTAECRRQGREPKPELFGALMDAFPHKDAS